MNDVAEGRGDPFRESTVAETAEAFARDAAEYYDSLLVVCCSHPFGPSDRAVDWELGFGNPYAYEGLLALYLDGRVCPGAWYVDPVGVLPLPDGSPAEWSGSLSSALESHLRQMEAALRPRLSSFLAVATAGEGPEGATRAVVVSSGNSMAAAAAAAAWLGRRGKDREP